MNEICKNCKFFFPYGNQTQGTCKGLPRQYTGDNTDPYDIDSYNYPIGYNNDTCSLFQPKTLKEKVKEKQ